MAPDTALRFALNDFTRASASAVDAGLGVSYELSIKHKRSRFLGVVEEQHYALKMSAVVLGVPGSDDAKRFVVLQDVVTDIDGAVRALTEGVELGVGCDRLAVICKCIFEDYLEIQILDSLQEIWRSWLSMRLS